MFYVKSTEYYDRDFVNMITAKVVNKKYGINLSPNQISGSTFVEKSIVEMLLPYMRWENASIGFYADNCNKTVEYLINACKKWDKMDSNDIMTDEEKIKFFTGYVFAAKDSDFYRCKYNSPLVGIPKTPLSYEILIRDLELPIVFHNRLCEKIQTIIKILYNCYARSYSYFPKYDDKAFDVKSIANVFDNFIIPRNYMRYIKSGNIEHPEISNMLNIFAMEYFVDVYIRKFTPSSIVSKKWVKKFTKDLYAETPTSLRMTYKCKSKDESIKFFRKQAVDLQYQKYSKFLIHTNAFIRLPNEEFDKFFITATDMIHKNHNFDRINLLPIHKFINEMVFKFIRNHIIDFSVERCIGCYGVNPDNFTFDDSLIYTSELIDSPNKSIISKEIKSKIREMIPADTNLPYPQMVDATYRKVKWENLKYDKDGNIIMTKELSDQCSLVAYKVISKYADKLTGMTMAYDPYTGKKWTKIIPIIE